MHAPAALGRTVPAVALVALLLFAADALACGACVSPQPPPGKPDYPVLQNAERVLFYVDKDKNTVAWVEVRYQGLADNFGWVLPLPKVPKVAVGSAVLFDRLDAITGQRYDVTQKASENCHSRYDGCDLTQGGGSSSGSSSSSGGSSSGGATSDAGTGVPGGTPDTVKVLDHGTTGPYDYVVVKGSDAKDLTTWLNKHKFITPKAATPIVDAHIKKGDVFLAIKLANGAGVEQIAPVILTMKDADPCVPLRLTSIAAVEDMSVVVTVAGPGRSVVKNHLDAVVNHTKVNLFQKANNYGQVVSAAIDEAGGHAFVTEFSQPAAPYKGQIKSSMSLVSIKAAKNVFQLANALFAGGSTWLHPDMVTIIDKEAGLKNLIPYKAKTAAAAAAWLWSCGSLWSQSGGFQPCNYKGATLTPNDAKQTPFPGVKVSEALKTGVIDPVYAVADAIGATKQLTRMVLRIDPQEMDRDPIFAFSTDGKLPNVSNRVKVTWNRVCSDGWAITKDQLRLAIQGYGSWLVGGQMGKGTSALDKRWAKAPFARAIVLQEEAGAPIYVGQKQADAVDAAIAGAQPGKASLPSSFKVTPAQPWAIPPSDAPLTEVGPWCPPTPWCVPKKGWSAGTVPPGYPGAGKGPGPSICQYKGAPGTSSSGASSTSSGGSSTSSGGSSSGSASSSSGSGSSGSGSSGGSDASTADGGSSSGTVGASSSSGGSPDDDGCAATPTGHSGVMWLLLLALSIVAIRRWNVAA